MKKQGCVPVWVKASLIFAVLSLLIYALCINVRAAADFINSTVSVAIRFVMSCVTYLLPFSLFEILIILLPVLLVLLIVRLVRNGTTAKRRVRVLFSLVGVISLILSSYIFMLGIGYHTTPIADRMGITDSANINTDALYRTTLTVRNETNALADKLEREGGVSVMPYSVDELSARIVDAYENMNDEYALVTNFTSRAKPVIFSTVMSDLRITGIYSFFTGEANVNVEYPDYNLPFTVAHELAHQRGVCRENEANFVAFLVCISSNDDFIRYSGYLNLYEYLSSALYRADKSLYTEVREGLSELAFCDTAASNAVYAEHKDSVLGKINERVNDTYLKLNGTQGTVTYGYVVRLAVSYYENKAE